ncbi:hypothetical protein LINPERPRIM_LOCUS39753, partial [Linum perenne]
NYKPETHFVASSDGTTIQIYKLTTDPTTHPSSIRKEHWKNVATINTTAKDHQDVSLYDGLQFEDNHGRIEGRESLTMLAQHLAQLGFLCFHDVIEHEMFVELEIHYLRLNDLFCWSHHGVNQSLTTSWSRSELKQHVPEGGDKLEEEIERLKKEKKDEKEELEKCQKQESWTFLPSTTKLVRANSETKQKYLERRQRVPPGTFALQTNFGFPYVSNSVNLVDNMSIWSMGKVDLVDEPESSIKEWPPLRTQYVRIGNGSAVDFDTSDWWYLKTTHPEGGLTMLVYYEHYKKIDI